MSLKLEFVQAACQPAASVTALCLEYGISRQTGHKWLRRYRQMGYLGLEELSRRPTSSPTATAEDIVRAAIEVRNRHPSWGAKKISLVLARTLGGDAPSKSTVARLLRRFGKISKKRPPVRLWMVDGRPRVDVQACNDLWTIDFKGWWRAKNGERCEPLTIRDACSRKLLAVKLLPATSGVVVRKVLEQLFEKHGVPRAILVDNGSPWVSPRARGGLTRLSVWIVSLGIKLVRTRPGSPQDNGGHERMHRDLAELQGSPARSRRAQQPICDRWMLEFNHVRPHDALEGKTPEEVYVVREPRRPEPRLPLYPPDWTTRRASTDGKIYLHGDHLSIGSALAGQLIGLRHEQGLKWRAYFFEVDLGLVEVAATAPMDLRPEGPSSSTTRTKKMSARSASRRRPKAKIVNTGVTTKVSAMS